MKRFVFLVCSERSGSNFITSLMNGHSRVSGPPPTHLFRLFATNRGHYGDLSKDEHWRLLSEDIALNFSCKLGSWTTSMTAQDLRDTARTRSAAELLRILYEREAASDGATHVFVKENHTYAFAPFILAHFPRSLFVFLVRDPRDVAKSWVQTTSIPGGVEKAVEIWLKDQRGAADLSDQLADSGRGILVRYEELVAAAETTLRHLAQYMGLPYEETMLEFNKDRRTRANAERIDAWSNLLRPVMRDNAGKYKEVLSESDQRYVELACGDLMRRYGYTPELEREVLSDDLLELRLAELRPRIHRGGYEIPSEQERSIRDRRLAAIHQVLDRRL